MVDPIPAEQWEQHKKEILRLYIDEDLPLRHVMKRVCTRNFHPEYVILIPEETWMTEPIQVNLNTVQNSKHGGNGKRGNRTELPRMQNQQVA